MSIDIDDREFAQRTFQQFMDLFVIPEVRSRQKSGLLENPFNIQAAQVIFYSDARRTKVRINSEVKAQVVVTVKNSDIREKTTHSSVHNRYNREASIGNYQPQHRETYYKLYDLMKKARYLKGDYTLSDKEGSELLEGGKEMIEYSFLRIKT